MTDQKLVNLSLTEDEIAFLNELAEEQGITAVELAKKIIFDEINKVLAENTDGPTKT